MDPVAVDEFDNGQAVFFDLDMSLEYVAASRRFCSTFRVILRPYQEPGNAYAYIPFKVQILPLATYSMDSCLNHQATDS